MTEPRFDPHCSRCPRLVSHLHAVRQEHPDYHAAPVPAFGAELFRLLIVGLAPGMHGANRTGRPFTGDFAGVLLYQTLHRLGLCSHAQSLAADDGLALWHCRITNAVKCLPPANRPSTAEIAECNGFLRQELTWLPAGGAVLALGRVAHDAVLRALDLRPGAHRFAHQAEFPLPGDRWLVDSYHCSRYNTQTGRLSAAGFLAATRQAAHRAGLTVAP